MGWRLLPAFLTLAALTVAMTSVEAIDPSAAPRFWPEWRGPFATGANDQADPPVEWGESKNVRWKVEIPGRGMASPVVWGDRVYLLSAVPVGVTGDAAHSPRGSTRGVHRYVVMAINRKDGKVVWEHVAREAEPHEGAHQDNGTWASSSAVTDGEHLIASFESRGIYAYDMNGKLVWQQDLGDKRMRNEFGEGSTPTLYRDRLVVVWDHQGESFIVALDKRTGKEIWRATRDEIDTWATPLVVEHNGRAQVVTGGMKQLRSYDLETGKLVWHSAGTTMNAIPSPVTADGMIYVMSGFRGSNLKAIKVADATGDLTNSSAIAWQLDRDTPYVPSPLLYKGVLYFLKSNSGILSAFDAKSGQPLYAVQRLDGVDEVYSSPVAAKDRVYVTSRSGTTLVIRHGPKYEVIATNVLNDGFDASAALVDREIYLRGYKYLYCIASS
jgi:outer membrane protein assembly factor BamB